jgi:uncharacterized membrane protein
MLAIGVAIAWAPAVMVLGLPLCAAALIALRSNDRASRSIAGLFTLGFVLALLPEFVYIQDVFADRMNTVFKLYFQAWLLLASAAAVGLVTAIQRSHGLLRITALTVTGAIVLGTLTYAPLSANDWTNGFASRRGLDGALYLATANPGEWDAIVWVSEHADAGDSIIEAPGCAYQTVDGVPMNRVSSFSGVPTLIGWSNHEGQWRRGQNANIYEQLGQLRERANAILDGEVPAEQSGARFLILGRQELQGAAVCVDIGAREEQRAFDAIIDSGWTLVFQRDGIRVFVPERDSLADERR